MSELELSKLIAKEIHETGGNSYYVGGYVRDKILGKENKDIDIEIYGVEPEKLAELLSKYGKVDKIGATFGVYKIEGIDIDFCLPRKEKNTGTGHKDVEVQADPYLSTYEASKRRDFTINSIMENVYTGEIIDHFGGRKDIEDRVIKYVDAETFIEDPLRALRACQFAARLEFEIAPNTVELCQKSDLTCLPKERILEEVNKGLTKAKKPSIFIEKLKQIGKLNEVFLRENGIKLENEKISQVENILDKATEQEKEGPNKFNFLLASLVYGLHLIAPQNIDTEVIIKNLTDQKDVIASVDNIVRHNIMLENNEYKINLHEFRKFVIASKSKYFNINDLVLLNNISTNNPQKNQELQGHLKNTELNEQSTIAPIITGEYLMSLGMIPGKLMGQTLRKCFDLQLQGKTKEEIKEYANGIEKEKEIEKEIEK